MSDADGTTQRGRRVGGRWLGRALAVVLAAIMVFALASAAAAQPKRGRGKGRPRPDRAAETTRAKEAAAAAIEGRELEEGEGRKVKEFRFSGLDVSGRLKSPQILYFLNRLRAEFDRPRLPHRSFVPELVRSSKGNSF